MKEADIHILSTIAFAVLLIGCGSTLAWLFSAHREEISAALAGGTDSGAPRAPLAPLPARFDNHFAALARPARGMVSRLTVSSSFGGELCTRS